MRLTIGRLILFGTLGVIMCFLIGNIVGIVKLNDSIDKVEYINNNVEKSNSILLDFKELISLNRLYTNSRAAKDDYDDKASLIKLRDTTWVGFKEDYKENRSFFEDDTTQMDSLLADFDTLIILAKAPIIEGLNSFDDYNDMMATMMAEDFVTSSLTPESKRIKGLVDELFSKKSGSADELKGDMILGFDNLVNIIIIVSIIALLAGLLIAFWLNQMISKPILKLTNVVNVLGKGETPDNIDYNRDNEIGDIFKSINNLIVGIKSYTFFATDVGEGKLESEFEKLGEKDVLGTSLLDMRTNLVKVAEEERKRSWSTEGLAKFGAILRQEEDIVKLSQSIVSNLVKYVNANQAGIFVVYENDQEQYLELKAAYAYERQKFLDKTVKKGQGLVGQCWHEGEYIYMTDIPGEYINIGSGLGESKPKCILIVPLVYNDEILGIVELASFNEFSDFEIEFILKLGESIAATISTAKVSESTSKLLANTNEMTEQLQSQEEELRQQTEELMATQEESERKFLELEKQYSDLKKENTKLKSAN